MMSDLDELKTENKKLKRLLKDAVALLHKYKDVIQNAQRFPIADSEAKPDKKMRKKKSAKHSARATKKK